MPAKLSRKSNTCKTKCMITGRKYYDNKETMKNNRAISDKLCRKYGVSVISSKSEFKPIDQTTMQLALKHKSWNIKPLPSINEQTAFIAEYEAEVTKASAFSVSPEENSDDKFRYQLLSRMQSDCNYMLGNGGAGAIRYLDGENVDTHIHNMLGFILTLTKTVSQ